MLFTFLYLIAQILKKIILACTSVFKVILPIWSFCRVSLVSAVAVRAYKMFTDTSRSSTVFTVTRIRVGRPRNRSSIPGRVRDLYLLQRAGCYFTSVRRQERESERSALSGREFKNVWAFTYTTPFGFTLCCLTEHTDNVVCVGHT
jgi:hypothetical protein